MRKFQYMKILELLETLNEVNLEIQRFRDLKNNTAVITLINDSTEFAAQIRGFVDNVSGKETKTASYIDEYIDILSQTKEELVSNNTGSNFLKRMQKQVLKIENSVNNELNYKYEVLFLPYKASMWDSLESIWTAAKDDSQCDVYVVSIPYYEFIRETNTNKFCYEGGQYPDYVPVVDWRTYDIEKRRPDIIFIHNPYDNENYVTSVHPDYYSSKLRNFTDLLVYSPYFVTGDTISSAFCTAPGCVNAHKVLVESEKIRDEYIKAFKEAFGNKVPNLGDKFVAIGSPKYDAVINKKREDFSLPDEWENLMNGKKMVLYNTSIGSILTHGKQYLDKLRYVFSYFSNRDDAALWWRPHPLSAATYASMRPQLAEEYNKLEEDYKNRSFGIYDNTPDLNRAIACTDAYYGDGSSLVFLYQCLEKPVMYQNVNYLGKDNIPLVFLCDSGDALWTSCAEFNALFKIDKNTWEAEYMGSFPGEEVYKVLLHTNAFVYDRRIFFLPLSADCIDIYDIDSKTFSRCEIPYKDMNEFLISTDGLYIKFASVYEIDGKLCFLPYFYSGIIIYDINKNTIRIVDDWIKDLEPYIFDNKCGYFIYGLVNNESNSIMAVCLNANAAVEFNINSMETKVHKLGDEYNSYIDCVFIDGVYWLLSLKKASLLRWDLKNNIIEEFEINLKLAADNNGCLFLKLIDTNDGGLLLVPVLGGRFMKFDIFNRKFYPVEKYNEFLNNNENKAKISFLTLNKVYFKDVQYRCTIEFDALTEEIREGSMQVKDPGNMNAIRNYLKNILVNSKVNTSDCVLKETLPGALTIDTVVDALTQSEDYEWLNQICAKQAELSQKRIVNGNGKAGQKIWDMCKKEMGKHQ